MTITIMTLVKTRMIGDDDDDDDDDNEDDDDDGYSQR